jgi:hypothetical protein
MSLNRLLLPFVPAEAGTQLFEFSALDFRFRGNERRLVEWEWRCKPEFIAI